MKGSDGSVYRVILIAPITGVGKVRIPTMALKMYWKAAQKE
jgi:hypothetical protein